MDYVIGDIHGCFQALKKLLKTISYNEKCDRLWFCGDFVNRGPEALSVLRFVSSLKIKPCVVLGNHDLHFLAVYFGFQKPRPICDNFDELFSAPDIALLVDWLLTQRLAIYDPNLNVLLTHAGICPNWDLKQTLSYAKEVEDALQDPRTRDFFFTEMYGNQPDIWSVDLTGNERLRVITNYLTRMRYLDKNTKSLLLQHKTVTADPNAVAWFTLVDPNVVGSEICFGHWAALRGNVSTQGIYGLDTGCYYYGTLTALCLQTRERTEAAYHE